MNVQPLELWKVSQETTSLWVKYVFKTTEGKHEYFYNFYSLTALCWLLLM